MRGRDGAVFEELDERLNEVAEVIGANFQYGVFRGARNVHHERRALCVAGKRCGAAVRKAQNAGVHLVVCQVHDFLGRSLHHHEDRLQLVDGVILKAVRAPCIDTLDVRFIRCLILLRKTQRGGRPARRAALLGKVEHTLCSEVIRRKGFIHIAALAGAQREVCEFFVLFRVTRGKHEQNIALFDELLLRHHAGETVFFAPCVRCEAALGAVDFGPGVHGFYLAV